MSAANADSGAPETGAAALYHAAIKTAARRASGQGRLAQPDVEITIDNPLCGDRVTMGAQLRAGQVDQIGHRVRGCLLCEACASLLAECCAGASASDLAEFLDALHGMLDDPTHDLPERWAGFAMFAPVAAFKSRHRCVTLPVEALREALTEMPAS